jgi:hypothetical protein
MLTYAGPIVSAVVGGVLVSLAFLFNFSNLADTHFYRRTLFATGLAFVSWIVVASASFASLTLLAVAVPLAAAIGYLMFVIWMLVGDTAAKARPLLVGSYFVMSVAAHIGFFAWLYLAIDTLAPQSFTEVPLSRPDAFYLAVTTFTTVGSGQLQPVMDLARASVAIESLLSVVIISVGVVMALKRMRLT